MNSDKYLQISCTLLIDLMLNHKGKENAVHSCEYERRFNISGGVLRSIIRKIRLQEGYPICSCKKGYFYPETQEEIIDTISRLRSSTRSYLSLCDSLIFNRRNINDGSTFGYLYDEDFQS